MSELVPLNSEVALIGTLISQQHRIADVFVNLTPDDFGDAGCKAVAKLMASGITTDAGIADYMEAAYVGGRTLKDYYTAAYEPERLSELVEIVTEHSRRRRLYIASQKLMFSAQNTNHDIDRAYEEFMRDSTSTATKQLSVESALEVESLLSAEPNIGRLFTGVPFFDQQHYADSGSRRGQLEYILAISKHGKSQYTGMLEMLYARRGYNIMHFQFEDSKFSTLTTLKQYDRGMPEDREALGRIMITDSCRTLQDMDLVLRRISSEKQIDVIVVDFVQNVRVAGISDVRERVSTVSSTIRDWAKDYNCYVIGISQVSRDKMRRGYDAFPHMNDGKESSQIEHDAFLITSVFRPNMLEELQVGDRVKAIDGTSTMPWNTVYVKKRAQRVGVLDTRPAAFEHTGFGLQIYNSMYDEGRHVKASRGNDYGPL